MKNILSKLTRGIKENFQIIHVIGVGLLMIYSWWILIFSDEVTGIRWGTAVFFTGLFIADLFASKVINKNSDNEKSNHSNSHLDL